MRLHLANQTFDQTSILADNDWPSLPYFAQTTLAFCRQWLLGQASFTIRTSGSTGIPKAIAVSRAHMQASAAMTIQALGLRPNDRALVCLNTQYIAGMMMLVRGMENSMEIHVVEASANPLQAIGNDMRFDFTALVPMQLQTILQETPEKKPILDGMKAIIVGGAPLNMALETEIQRLKAAVYHTYGMTETVSHIALRRLNGAARTGYFKALEGVTLQTDERGCLCIKAAVTDNQWLVTNDLVNLIDAQTFTWLGRYDNTINSGGVKIQLEKVEQALAEVMFALGLHRDCMVGGIPHPLLGECLVVVMESEPIADQTQKLILEKLAAKLTKYELPKTFYYLPVLDRTPTGKIDKLKILKQLNA